VAQLKDRPVSLRLSTDLVEQLDGLAERRGTSRNNLISILLTEGVARAINVWEELQGMDTTL